jgi:hypothetical protein
MIIIPHNLSAEERQHFIIQNKINLPPGGGLIGRAGSGAKNDVNLMGHEHSLVGDIMQNGLNEKILVANVDSFT